MSAKRDGFTQPPWVMGSPKEVMDWIEASHPDKKEHEGKKGRHVEEYLTDVKIKFDFNVNSSEIKPTNFLSKITGKKLILEDFDLMQTTEVILRGLAKAKFKNLAKIVLDGKTLYEHPEKKTDLRKTIDHINEYSREISEGNKLEVSALLDDIKECTAIIRIKKIHKKKEKSIEIHMEGQIKKSVYHTFLNYLDEKIGFKAED